MYTRLEQLGSTLTRGDREGNIPEEVDVVIDCASYGNLYGQIGWEKINYANFERVVNIINQEKKFKDIILTSSSSVTMGHLTDYANAKRDMEWFATEVAELEDRLTIIRPYTIYGPDDNPTHLIPTVFRSCLDKEPMKLDPIPTHDYIYVEDLVDVYLSNKKGLIEAGRGEAVSNGKIVKIIEGLTDRSANVTEYIENARPYDQQEWKAPEPIMGRLTHMVGIEAGLENIYRELKPEAFPKL